MKKAVLILFSVVFFMGQNVFAAAVNEDESLINTIGESILSSNHLPKAKFVITSTPDTFDDYFVKANVYKKVEMFTGELAYAKDKGELTAVIASQVGKISNNMPTVSRSKSTSSGVLLMDKGHEVMSFKSTKILSYQKLNQDAVSLAADRTGVDFMIQNGDNPLALLSVYGNYPESDKAAATARIMNIYDYISYNFPDKLKQGYSSDGYEKAMKIVNEKLSGRTQAENQRIADEQAKIKEKKLKQANSSFKSMNPWNSSYTTLQLHK